MVFKHIGYSSYTAIDTYQFSGSLEQIKKTDNQDSTRLTAWQKVANKIKNFFLYIPVLIAANQMEKYLFPKKNRDTTSPPVGSSSSSEGSQQGCGCCTGFDLDDINGLPRTYQTKELLLQSEEGSTSLKWSKLSRNCDINGVLHDDRQKKLLIYFQGNGTTLEDYHGLMEQNMETNLSFCMIDWPKHGKSQGKLSHESMLKQAELVYQFATTTLNYREEDILVEGTSLGCYQALSLAERHPNISNLKLDQPFTTTEQISCAETYCAKDNFILRWVGNLMKRAIQRYYNFNNMTDIHLLNNFKGSIKVIRRTNDTLTSLDKNNLTGSCLTNEVIKKIIEQRHGHEFTVSDEKKRAQWMDDYLSTEHIESSVEDPSEDDEQKGDQGDQPKLIKVLRELVQDKHIDITGGLDGGQKH